MTEHEEAPGRPCQVCSRRDADEGLLTCEACPSWLDRVLRDLPDLVDELGNNQQVVDSRVRVNLVKTAVPQLYRRSDPVAGAVPMAPVAGKNRNPKVAGTPGRSAPLAIDRVDIVYVASDRRLTLEGRRWPDDQIGHTSVGSLLDSWVQQWREQRREAREGRPVPTVPVLSSWLAARLDWAVEHSSGIGDLADEVADCRRAMRQLLGLNSRPDVKVGVRCRGCERMSVLFQVNGSDWVECSRCPELLSPEEYARWTGLNGSFEAADLGYKTVPGALRAVRRRQRKEARAE